LEDRFGAIERITGWDPSRIARAWVVLMKRLGYTRFAAQGGDWGAMVADVMGTQAPPELLGIHVNWPFAVPPEIDKAALIAGVFDGHTERLTLDDIVTLYWLTNTTVSSARIYWENKFSFFAPKHVAIPVAVSAFPDEVVQTPRTWAERAYANLIYYNRLEKGGHFAAWEQPGILSEEIRLGFRSLRD